MIIVFSIICAIGWVLDNVVLTAIGSIGAILCLLALAGIAIYTEKL